MFNSLVLATTPVVGGFQKLSNNDFSFTWNVYTVGVIVLGLLLVFVMFKFVDGAATLFFSVPMLFMLTFISQFIALGFADDGESAKAQLPDYDRWVSERYGLNGLPKDILEDLYGEREVDLVNFGSVTMMEQGEDTFYLVYTESKKELPVVGDTSGQEEKTNSW